MIHVLLLDRCFLQCIQAVPSIIKVMKDGIDAEKVCTDIKLCTGN